MGFLPWLKDNFLGAAVIGFIIMAIRIISRKIFNTSFEGKHEALFFLIGWAGLTLIGAVAKHEFRTPPQNIVFPPAQSEAVPNLKCQIDGVAIQPNGSNSPDTWMQFGLKIVNDGSPSVAWKWKARVEFSTGGSIESTAPENPTIGSQILNGQTNFIPAEYYLPNSLVEKPIERGAGKVGWVGFVFADPNYSIQDINAIGSRYFLSFEDCRGRVTTAIFTNKTKLWGKLP